jgi:hypothetical protein
VQRRLDQPQRFLHIILDHAFTHPELLRNLLCEQPSSA